MSLKNTSEIKGNYNIVIQGCNLSSIKVEPILSIDDFDRKLRALYEKDIYPINVLIITTNIDNISKYLSTNVNLEDYYGSEHKDWKPYKNESIIIELLKEYQTKSGFRIKAFILDSQNFDVETTLINRLKLRQENTILIADGLALSFMGNQKIANIFNHNNIGGCLIPICTTHTANILQRIKENIFSVFYTLVEYINNYSEIYLEEKVDNGFVHIELNIPNKNELFRRLTNIATLYLQPIPTRQFPDLDEFESPPLNPYNKKS